jgi:hypothetical protein
MRSWFVGCTCIRVFFLYRIESGWVGLCRGVGRGYTGVALKGGGAQEVGVGECGWAGV